MKVKFIAIACLSLALLLGGCDSTSSQSSSENSSTNVTSEEAQKITADDFVNLFASDVDAAEKNNKGKVFEITGAYEGDLFGSTIQMSSTKGYDSYETCELRFDISKEDFEAIGDVSKGDLITLKATFKKVTSYTLEFEDTSYISTSKASEITSEAENELKEPEEHNSNEYVDYLAQKAKQDSATASDELIQEAVQWISTNIDSIFKDNESMENAMYYGELLEYKHKDTGNEYEKLGWQAFKTVKYVYRGVENVEDEVTVNNYNELREIINTISGSNISEVKEEPTQQPDIQLETEALTENIVIEAQANTVEQAVANQSQRSVYIADSGNSKKYHSDPECSNMDGSIGLTIEEAEAQGYTACKKCFG